MRRNALGFGTVKHRRHGPRRHDFSYRLVMPLLDLDALDATFARSRLWSQRGWAPVRFWRPDYMGPAERDLASAVRDRVESELGRRPSGRIAMLANLRQWGYCFNPVSFYFCHDGEGELDAIAAQITNTPWAQRHTYVLDARAGATGDGVHEFAFRKAFHVSPFLPMALDYRWRFTLRGDACAIFMQVSQAGNTRFDVSFALELQELDPTAMRRLAWRYPLAGQRVIAAIYWQALVLWLKKTPYHPNPSDQPSR